MNKWSDIKIPKPEPTKEKLPPETDWLKEVETVKKECRVKTKTANVIYPTYKHINLKNYTETN